jgi:hypothetical protein
MVGLADGIRHAVADNISGTYCICPVHMPCRSRGNTVCGRCVACRSHDRKSYSKSSQESTEHVPVVCTACSMGGLGGQSTITTSCTLMSAARKTTSAAGALTATSASHLLFPSLAAAMSPTCRGTMRYGYLPTPTRCHTHGVSSWAGGGCAKAHALRRCRFTLHVTGPCCAGFPCIVEQTFPLHCWLRFGRVGRGRRPHFDPARNRSC